MTRSPEAPPPALAIAERLLGLVREAIAGGEINRFEFAMVGNALRLATMAMYDERGGRSTHSTDPNRITLDEWYTLCHDLASYGEAEYDSQITWDESGNHRTDGLPRRDDYEVAFPPEMRNAFVLQQLRATLRELWPDGDVPPNSRTARLLAKLEGGNA